MLSHLRAPALLISLACLATGLAMAQPLRLDPHRFEAGSATALRQQLKQWLGEQLRAQGLQADVVAQGMWGVSDKAGAQPLRMAATLQSEVHEGNQWQITLQLVPVDADPRARAATARFGILEHQQVWTLQAGLRKGDAVSCAQLRRETRARHTGLASWQGDCTELEGLVARRALAAGDVLVTTDVGQPQAVQAQSEAIVLSRVQGIEIQAKGLVLADAAIGQRVPVRIHGQSRVIQGLVTGPAQIQVMEGM